MQKAAANQGIGYLEVVIVLAITVLVFAILSPMFADYTKRTRVRADLGAARELATDLRDHMALNLEGGRMATQGLSVDVYGRELPEGMEMPGVDRLPEEQMYYRWNTSRGRLEIVVYALGHEGEDIADEYLIYPDVEHEAYQE